MKNIVHFCLTHSIEADCISRLKPTIKKIEILNRYTSKIVICILTNLYNDDKN